METTSRMIGSQRQDHLPTRSGYCPTWYVSDLPGHAGTVRIKAGPERNSDWGWTDKRKKAIILSPYWQRRFVAYGPKINRTNNLETA